ncbi:MAG: response regulator transcription factor [Pseudomonadota bacterium]|nr:response regulator transcription factor [Pseudomonadota bacterium]MDO7710544.1 response regulator transcription factor [Pseudomonadota bacterium]
MNKINVMVADDNSVIRAGLRRYIEDELDINVIGEANCIEHAYPLFNELNPHVLLIGCLYTRGMSGLEALRRILIRHPSAIVIVYTLQDDLAFAGFSLSCGARGYITGLSDTDELIKAIRTVLTGKIYISSNMAKKIESQAMTDAENPLKSLSTREFEMFRLLAEGCSVKEISEILSVGTKTVANYQTNIKHKLDLHSPVDIVRMAMRYDVIAVH